MRFLKAGRLEEVRRLGAEGVLPIPLCLGCWRPVEINYGRPDPSWGPEAKYEALKAKYEEAGCVPALAVPASIAERAALRGRALLYPSHPSCLREGDIDLPTDKLYELHLHVSRMGHPLKGVKLVPFCPVCGRPVALPFEPTGDFLEDLKHFDLEASRNGYGTVLILPSKEGPGGLLEGYAAALPLHGECAGKFDPKRLADLLAKLRRSGLLDPL